MDEALITAVQASVDAKAYPPTHEYDVRTLRPRGVLADRLRIILGLCPSFFVARRFLDVGCSKGFFSLLAAVRSEYVLAVDPDAEALEAWAPVSPPNVQQRLGSFVDLGDEPFDRVWIGNGHHYLHREDRGWTSRLARLASDRVMIEGPTGPEASGFEGWAPGTVPVEAEWLASLGALGFRLMGRQASPSYTPGRAVWYLRKMR